VRLALIGNCQVQTLSAIVRQMLEDADIRIFDYSHSYARDETVRQSFSDQLRDCDFIFTQTALMSHTNEGELRARYGDRVVTIANFYFRGLFPDSCYVGDFSHRLDIPSAVNSVVVLDAYRRGLSEDQALNEFNVEVYERLGLLNAWESSMTEMWAREANGIVDVPGAALMEQACRTYPAFLTMNHPAAPMLTEYLAAVFQAVGVRHQHINIARMIDPLSEHDTTPVLDLVAEHYGLPYRTSQRWKINSLGRRFIGIEEYISNCYAAYRAYDPARLLVHSPSDLVPYLRSHQTLAYLVDPAVSPHVEESSDVPAQSVRQAMASAVAPVARSVEILLRTKVAPVANSVEELKIYMHKVHSYLEVADPKIERLTQLLPRLERLEARVESIQAAPQPPASALTSQLVDVVPPAATPRMLSASILAAPFLAALVGAAVLGAVLGQLLPTLSL
jgi:hypothetical protein